VIAPRERPLGAEVLRGNLCPQGAVIRPTAMDPRSRNHCGPAVVFHDYNDLERRTDTARVLEPEIR
jgi:dihydroxyacid dehydratase/phosphogluconate dehydratase